jgi:hypothetical protein
MKQKTLIEIPPYYINTLITPVYLSMINLWPYVSTCQMLRHLRHKNAFDGDNFVEKLGQCAINAGTQLT